MPVLTQQAQVVEDALAYLSSRLGLAPQPCDAEAFFAELGPPSAKDVERARGTSAASVRRLVQEDAFVTRLIASLEEEPIEDGRHHPAERLLAGVIERSPDAALWISSFVRSTASRRPAVAAAAMRCLGRLSGGLISPWGVDLAMDSLRSRSVEVREAAVRALESWGGARAVSALRAYLPDERVGWLRGYAEQVVVDLAMTAG